MSESSGEEERERSRDKVHTSPQRDKPASTRKRGRDQKEEDTHTKAPDDLITGNAVSEEELER